MSAGVIEGILEINPNIHILPLAGKYIVGVVGTRSNKLKKQAYVELQLGNGPDNDCVFLIVEKLTVSVIIGSDWLTEHGAIIDYRKSMIFYLQENK
jgi:hypothetical protein